MKDWIFDEVNNLISDGKKAKAAQILAKYIKRYPEDVRAWLMLADVLENQTKIDFAINKALALEPYNLEALKKLDNIKNQTSPQKAVNPDLSDAENSIVSDTGPFTPESYIFVPDFNQDTIEPNPSSKTKPNPFINDTSEFEKQIAEQKFKEDSEEKSRNKFLGLFFMFLLFISAIVVVYITKSIWSPYISQSLPEPAKMYFEAFEQNNNPLNLPMELNKISTEIALIENIPFTPMPTPTPLPTLSPNETIIYQVANEINQLRGISEVPDIDFQFISKEQANSKFITEPLNATIVENQKTILIALGLIEPYYDLEAYYQIESPIPQAFYNELENKLYVVDEKIDLTTRSDFSFAYLLWLQNMMTNIFTIKASATDADQVLAYDSFIIGDAVITQALWQEQFLTYSEKTSITPLDLTYSDWTIPPALFADETFSLLHGANFIKKIYEEAGMVGVQSIYSNFPKTTEQILHPEKYFSHELGISLPSVDIKSGLSDEWNFVGLGILGEWGTYQVLANGAKSYAQLEEIFAENAASGWGGDTYQVFSLSETENYILVAHWFMDSETDANELANGLENISRSRFNGPLIHFDDTACAQKGDMISCIFKNNRQVLWLIAPEKDLLTSILNRYPTIN